TTSRRRRRAAWPSARRRSRAPDRCRASRPCRLRWTAPPPTHGFPAASPGFPREVNDAMLNAHTSRRDLLLGGAVLAAAGAAGVSSGARTESAQAAPAANGEPPFHLGL